MVPMTNPAHGCAKTARHCTATGSDDRQLTCDAFVITNTT